ncbi:MAG: nucleotide pyrophosphohydrolase [Methanosarcinaceae archaeon]|nr:nucleotide pyrophosphohydrolase [Methanosarcinaceae archaeon]
MTNSDKILKEIKTFVSERDWDQFHTPENLAKSIVIESAELLEHFQWGSVQNPEGIKEEIADVLIYSFMLADKLDFDVYEIMLEKLEINKKKYPIEKATGNCKKYTEL